MSDLGTLLGNGCYVFFKSLANNPIPAFREAYSIAQQRIGPINAQISGKNLAGNKIIEATPDIKTFSSMIQSYLSQLKSIAASMRASEITYIQDLISQYEHDSENILISSQDKRTLSRLLNAEKISLSDYTTLINALNKVKYADQQSEFADIIKTQLTNMTVLNTNLNKLSKAEKEEAKALYTESYGKYTSKYAQILTKSSKIKLKLGKDVLEETTRVQKTNLDTLAKKINDTLEDLSENQDLIAVIKQEYAKHFGEDEKQFEIMRNQFISRIIDSIIDEIRAHPKQWSSTRANTIATKIIQDLSGDKTLRDLASNSQSYKVTFNKNTANDGETLIRSLVGGQGSKSVIKLLLGMDDVEKLLKELIPDKAQEYINELERIRSDINKATDDMQANITRDQRKFNKNIRNDFKSSALGKKLAEALASDKSFNLDSILMDQTDQFLEQVRFSLKDLAITVKKSSLAELIGSERAQKGIEKALSSKIGGSLNLKDDILYMVRTHKVKAPSEGEVSSGLQSALDEINEVLNGITDNYLEEYYNRENTPYANEQAGTTNTQKAREDYTRIMQNAADRLTKIYAGLKSTVKKELDAYAKKTNTFLGAISVKEYSLYQDEIGYHGGTLGPTAMEAVKNIQNMYTTGGISPIQMETLTFALLNCSDNAIGGAPIRTSLENYLLGGAALMMFDQGVGEAIPYLNKMQTTVSQLMPKNLNLYQLNSAYVPASFILETIYQNLSEFYQAEYVNYTEDIIRRNKVVITNPANDSAVWFGTDPQTMFEKTSANVLANINIQFIFMAGMIDIFTNLSQVFNV